VKADMEQTPGVANQANFTHVIPTEFQDGNAEAVEYIQVQTERAK
jgi:hypothetical protein